MGTNVIQDQNGLFMRPLTKMDYANMLKRILLVWMMATWSELPAQTERSIWGAWEGTVMIPGSSKMPTVTLRISQIPMDCTAIISMPEEEPLQLPIRVVKPQGDQVILSLREGGQYEGTMAADGRTIHGKWKLPSIELPLTLKLLVRFMPDTAAITEWIRNSSIPLKTVEPESSFEDMTRLKKVIGKSHIVAIGEATHGTREFFKLKHRIFEFLVEQMGFTVFALEANMPEARLLNDYVLSGNGDPQAALHGLYAWPWKAKELLEMIEWMRTYNANPAHQRKVKFYGFDMQVPNKALSNVLEYLKRSDPQYATNAEELLSEVPLTEAERDRFIGSPATNHQVVEQIGEVLAHLDMMPHDEAGWSEARQDALVIRQAVCMMLAGHQGVTLRDEAMAANVEWILAREGLGAKIMLWAHNDHVKTTFIDDKLWMGGHLRKRFGDEMVVMGFVFGQGAFRATDENKELRDFVVQPGPPDSLDAVLAAAKIPIFAIDLRTASKQSVIDWLRSPQKSREIGSRYSGDSESWQLEQSPADAFDVLLFVETTSPTRSIPPPIPSPPDPPPSVQPPLPRQPDTQKPFWQIDEGGGVPKG
jgi:erythromycin esterase